MKKAISIFTIVMCAVAIMTFNAMSATEVDPAVAAANVQGVIKDNKAQNDATRPESIIIEDSAIPAADAPETDFVAELVTTPEPELVPAPVALATPAPVEATPDIQDGPQAAVTVEPKQDVVLEEAAAAEETEVIEEATTRTEATEEEPATLVLYTPKSLTFKEDGDIVLVEEAGEDLDSMAICMMTIGKWFPTGDISLYNPTENSLGPAIAVYEDEVGNKVTCQNTFRVVANVESEETSLVLLRLLGQLENEGLANMVFRSDVPYNVSTTATDGAVAVNAGDAILVTIPDRELSGADFLTLVEGLQAQL